MADPTRPRRPHGLVDGYDQIEVASIDSFPASDPPGWIETKARPCDGHTDAAAAPAPARGSRRRSAKPRHK